MYLLLRPPPEWPRPRVRPGLPDPIHPVRPDRGAEGTGGRTGRSPPRPGRLAGLSLRRRRGDPRRVERLLSADGLTRNLRPAGQGRPQGPEPDGLAVVDQEHR